MKKLVSLFLAAAMLLVVFGMAEDYSQENALLSGDVAVELEAVPELSIDVPDDAVDLILDEGEMGLSGSGEIEQDDGGEESPEAAPQAAADPGEVENADSLQNASQGKVPATLVLGVKEQYALNTKSLAKKQKITYKSSRKAVARVSDKGVITAVKKGSATITCYREKTKVAACKVTVVKAPNKVSLASKAITLGVKESLALTPTIPKNTHASFTWTVKNKKVASVSKNGLVKGLKKGTTTVTVTTHNGKKASLTVKVLAAPKRVKLERSAVLLQTGKTLQLAVILPKNTASQIKWSSNNTKVAKVSDNGLVTAVAKGKATITAKAFNGKKATCTVTVYKFTNKAATAMAKAMGIPVDELAALAGVTVDRLNGMSKTKVKALEFDTGKFTWKLNAGYTGVIIVRYNGVSSAVKVEDRYYGLPVTEIGDSAFEGNKKLKKITLPATVTDIGAHAFKGCSKLNMSF